MQTCDRRDTTKLTKKIMEIIAFKCYKGDGFILKKIMNLDLGGGQKDAIISCDNRG